MQRAAQLLSALSVVCTFAALGTTACSKSDPPGPATGTATSTAAAPSAAPVAAASAAPAASSATGTPTAAVTAGSFSGKYEAKAGKLFLPDTKEMERVKWRGDEATEGLGAGELTLTIDADGRVHGESKGPLGALIVEGHADGDHVAATLTPSKADESAFTGTLEGDKKNGALEGELHAAGYNAGVLRTATFTLAGK